jgi:hypothetical protein
MTAICLEQEITLAYKTVIQAALTAASNSTAIRCFGVKDVANKARDAAVLPAVAIKTKPWISAPDSTHSTLRTAMTDVACLTSNDDDPHQLLLLALAEIVREAIEDDTSLHAAMDTNALNRTRVQEGDCDVDENAPLQSVTFSVQNWIRKTA